MGKTEQYKVVLGMYKGLPARRAMAEISDEELETAIKAEQKKFCQKLEVTDRPVELGDLATIDFTGYCDGEAFEGGAGTDYPLEIGSGTFIPGFEDQLVGAEIGADVDVNVTFPEDYGAPNLAGKPALFKCKVKKIETYHYPEIEAALQEQMRETLKGQKQMQMDQKLGEALVDVIIENSEIEVVEEAVAFETENLMKEWKTMMQMNGIDPEMYFQMLGASEDMVKGEMRPQAIKRLQSRLVLEAIAQTEKIEVSELELEQQLEMLAQQYKMERAALKEKLTQAHIDALSSDIRMTKALNFVLSNIDEQE